ncbi:MAG: C40 family peptidase [Steroidobacteraceae bacterium]
MSIGSFYRPGLDPSDDDDTLPLLVSERPLGTTLLIKQRAKFGLAIAASLCAMLAVPVRAEDTASALDQTVSEIMSRGVVDRALTYIGVPYRLGGNDPAMGFDCSGFVTYVYRNTLGMALPRTARQLATVGVGVTREELQPGDLVFFNTRGSPNSHVGIYLGDSKFVHAPRTRTLVRIDSLDDPAYARRYDGARRVQSLR